MSHTIEEFARVSKNSLFDNAKTEKDRAQIYKNVLTKIIELNHEYSLKKLKADTVEGAFEPQPPNNSILKRTNTGCRPYLTGRWFIQQWLPSKW